MKRDSRQYSNAVGLALRVAREQGNVSQEEMADRLRCSQALISRIEKGHWVKLWRFFAWADLCGQEPADLLAECDKAAELLQRDDTIGQMARRFRTMRSKPCRVHIGKHRKSTEHASD
jgi:transcriptional regulator with XRE-family HTH domain